MVKTRLHVYRIILIVLIILWTSVVFYLSSENGEASEDTSSTFVNIATSIYTKITNTVPSEHVEHILLNIVRKLAHFTLYFIGTFLAALLFKSYKLSKLKVYGFSLLFCILQAGFDEMHQAFVGEGRNGNFIDVLIDLSGGIVLVILFEIVLRIIKKLRKS